MNKNYFSKFIDDSYIRNVIGKLDLEILEIGYVSRQHDWWNRMFAADSYFRLYYLVSGQAQLIFSSGLFPLKPHELYLIPANVPFKYQGTEPPEHYWIHFASSMLEKLPWFKIPHAVTIKKQMRPDALLAQLVKLATRQNEVSNLLQIDHGVRQLLSPFLESMPVNENAESFRNLNLYSQVVDYIDRHLDREIQTPELAALMKMNRNEFSKSFHEAFAIPPKQYICRRRVDRAKILLLRDNMSIKQIAEAVGYSDEFYFYRIFKKYAFMTPNEYRQANNPCY